MEKEFEKFTIEYQLYQVNPVQSIDEAIGFIFDSIDRADYYRDMFRCERKKNKRDKAISRAFGGLTRFVGYHDPEFYDEDDGFIDIHEGILDKLYGQLTSLIQEIDDNNYAEIHKLASFTTTVYEANNSKVEERRKITGLQHEGVYMQPSLGEEDSEAYDAFFRNIIDEVSYVENVEKVKK